VHDAQKCGDSLSTRFECVCDAKNAREESLYDLTWFLTCLLFPKTQSRLEIHYLNVYIMPKMMSIGLDKD